MIETLVFNLFFYIPKLGLEKIEQLWELVLSFKSFSTYRVFVSWEVSKYLSGGKTQSVFLMIRYRGEAKIFS